MNTILNSAKKVLGETKVSVLDAARFTRNVLDAKPNNSKFTDAQFVLKVIEVGLRNIRTKEMNFADGFAMYLKSKQHLRPDSLRDIRCIGNRLLKTKPELGRRNFSELSVSECEEWINAAFHTPAQFKRTANEILPKAKDPKGEYKPKARIDAFTKRTERHAAACQTAYGVSASQFNKARTMLHGLFEFAIRREWCDKNPVKRILRKKVIEKEILPLKLSEIKRIIANAKKEHNGIYLPAVALLIFAGIRPREVRRLTWQDIDLQENTITIRSQCSKTGGVRQVEIMPQLKRILLSYKPQPQQKICPSNWQWRWRKIRDNSGFRGRWVQDVLRHTYASFFAKCFKDLARLQVNMGHSNQMLLQHRYINMRNISRGEAKCFFN